VFGRIEQRRHACAEHSDADLDQLCECESVSIEPSLRELQAACFSRVGLSRATALQLLEPVGENVVATQTRVRISWPQDAGFSQLPASVAIKDVHATPCFEIWLEKRRRSSASSKYSVWCFSPCSNPSREIRRPSLLLISLKGLPLWRSRAARHAARREAGKLYRIGYLGNTYTIIGSRGTRSSQEWLSSSPESVE
jgi:hypothetical protein